MTADTPYHWLSQVAVDDPARACLIDGVAVLTYGEVLARVDARAQVVSTDTEPWEIVPVAVAIDVDSIVEILAIQHAGRVPLPHTEHSPHVPVAVAPGTAVCVETSGSSGTPKVVPLTFPNIAASVAASRTRLRNGPDDRWLACLPLSHVGGLSVVFRSFEAGGSVIASPFDSSGGVIERLNPTIGSMVPTMVHRLADNNMDALASIGLLLVGGAALGRSLAERCVDAGVRLVPTYGLTEAGSQVATAMPGSSTMAPSCVGPRLDTMDVSIVGSDGKSVSVGATGLIAVDGPAVFGGYLGEEERHGRFVTNDRGWIDSDGMLHVEGRADDVIVSGGEKVSLGHVADFIGSLDGIDDVCIVGTDDDEWGAIIGAMVVASLPLGSFDKMVRRGLKPHERPKRWLKRSVIPTLPNGKHDRVAVRRELEEDAWT
jgi:O-succinylbenzoic acid--CoA ligase